MLLIGYWYHCEKPPADLKVFLREKAQRQRLSRLKVAFESSNLESQGRNPLLAMHSAYAPMCSSLTPSFLEEAHRPA